MVRSGSRLNSWKTVETPACWAWTGWLNDTVAAVELDRCRSSGWWTPARIFISVDLPAPFSPTRPCTSPARSSRSTSCEHGVADEALGQSRARARACSDRSGARAVRRHGVTVARVTHFCREARQKFYARRAKVVRVLHFRRARRRHLRAAARRPALDARRARGRHRPGPVDHRRPDRRADAPRSWWRRSAGRAPPAAARPSLFALNPARQGRRRRRRRRHPRARRPGRPLRRRSSARSATSLDVAEGPEARARLGVGDRARRC